MQYLLTQEEYDRLKARAGANREDPETRAEIIRKASEMLKEFGDTFQKHVGSREIIDQIHEEYKEALDRFLKQFNLSVIDVVEYRQRNPER